MKAFADNKFNVTEIMIYVFDVLENIVGKGENAVYQHFHLYPSMFSIVLCFRVVKNRDCVVKCPASNCCTDRQTINRLSPSQYFPYF